ncbi:hypothetical protein [Vreelandella stevensii]|uniref:hypothetical protein n=1 Tax=Vreelandella stevensii TaxID=502821 RepID=UPI00403A8100
MIRGAISGREYLEEHIFDSHLYPRMKKEPLLNDDGCLVVPVRNENAPHFRRIGSPSFGKRLGRDENNPTHDNCVKFLFDELTSDQITRVRFSTYVFNDNRKFEEQVIFEPLQESEYLWFMENDCRVSFSDETYIKPDLSGRDSSKFFPRAAYPNVVLEVIRTHIPDQKTFQKLLELSKCNHHIYFYFIAESKDRSRINHFKTEEKIFTIRVSHYLIGGKLFRNGKEFHSQRANESFEEWYKYLENSYFLKAKKDA